jgi:hypothetical protein
LLWALPPVLQPDGLLAIGADEMSENFSAKETFAIYGESETTVTFVRDEFFTEEKTFPTMRDAVDYLKALSPIPLEIVLRIRAHGRDIPFDRKSIAKLMHEL